MGETEKFLGCMELRTGALIWGFAVIFVNISVILFYLADWLYYYEDIEIGIPDADVSFKILGFLFFLCTLWVYVRFVQGIFKNNTEFMEWGNTFNYLGLLFVLFLIILYFSRGSFDTVLFLLPLIVWVYHIHVVCEAYAIKVQEENKKDLKVEYRNEVTSKQPLIQTQPQPQTKPQLQLQPQPEPQQKSPV